ncbi:hypothetical protein LO763_22560 [Glycomyces sp. A-F 0318]|uniref:hypothetical protein n=1 Tax=Glycomyces amatae TaxID=2881355 RepID=UPI001E64433C|nr:hypothetical protein [Glycomyces amatae]MCD0446402.1 hypothetical protein [Glycomyces amatae]
MARTPAAPRYTLTHYPHPLTGTANGADTWGPDSGTWTVTGIDPAADRYRAEIVACRCDRPKCKGWHAANIRKVAATVDPRHRETRGPATPWGGLLLPAAGQWTPTGPAWAHDPNLPLPGPDKFHAATIEARADTALWLADPDIDPAQRAALATIWHVDDLDAILDKAAAALAARETDAIDGLRHARQQVRNAKASITKAARDLWDAEHGTTAPNTITRLVTAKANAEADVARWEHLANGREATLTAAREVHRSFIERRRRHAARTLATAA